MLEPQRILFALTVVWLLFEAALAWGRRPNRRRDNIADRRSVLILWITVVASASLAMILRKWPVAHIVGFGNLLHWAAGLVTAAGIVLRGFAILTLGHFFTVAVAIRPDHRVVRTGPYLWVRHPSYAGLLIAFVGLGFNMGSWLSVVTLIVPTFLALNYRIGVEEQALRLALGRDYDDYCQTTRRLIPGIY